MLVIHWCSILFTVVIGILFKVVDRAPKILSLHCSVQNEKKFQKSLASEVTHVRTRHIAYSMSFGRDRRPRTQSGSAVVVIIFVALSASKITHENTKTLRGRYTQLRSTESRHRGECEL